MSDRHGLETDMRYVSTKPPGYHTTMMQLVTRPISGSFLFFVAVMQTPECLFHQRRRIVADREAKGERQQQAFVKATGFIVIVQGSCICRVPRVQYRQVGIH